MTNDKIKTLALSCGFTERPQDNGEMDLNPYVYVSHRKAYDIGFMDGAKHSDWMPCSERLPDSDKKYLVLCDNGSVWTGHYNLPSKPNEWYLHGWLTHGGYHPFMVTHFMEIPQPPNEVQND